VSHYSSASANGSRIFSDSLSNIPLENIPSVGNWVIDYAEISLEDQLGRGAYGVVYRGKWRNVTVAVKKISSELTTVGDFVAEASLMCNLRPHDNVVQLLAVCKEPPAVVMKFYANGSLLQYIYNTKRLTKIDFFTILKGIAAGMNHLHREKIVHRDLACRNVLINSNAEAVVSDFGLARMVHKEVDSAKTQSLFGPIKWMAPESIQKQIYSLKTDCWMFGVTCWEILTKEIPYPDMDLIVSALAITRGERLVIPGKCPPKLAEMIQSCWLNEPDLRPTFQDIYNKLEKIEAELDPRWTYVYS